jgi:Uncharacterized protein conserved in bacteria
MTELEEFNYINSLYDLYRPLFTKKQVLVMDNYYKYNLSLSEIATNLSISRSAVGDTISHSKDKLIDFENKLHLRNKNEKIKKLLEDSSIDDKIKKEILEELYYGI